MSKALKVVATVASAVALIAGGYVAFGPAGAVAAATKVLAVASITATVATTGSQALARPPPVRGSVSQVLIDADAPQPYAMGEGLFAGVLRHDVAYGATLDKIPNPYRLLVIAYSGGGPVQSLTPYVDFAPVDAWYSAHLFTSQRLGFKPALAMVPYFAGAPGWTPASRMSGVGLLGWNAKFDKKGKRFASGLPRLAAYGQWVKVYDPRLDSTFPGGVGPHRIGTESTYEWSENPALHAATYAYGRYQNGKRTVGIGLPADAIDWANVAAWANVCTANGWTIFGVVYEPGDRFANLRDIAQAGGAEPVLAADFLSFHYAAPRVSLDTVTEDDLADGDSSVTPMASWRDRLNTVIPKYRSPNHNWEMVQADPVSSAGYVSDDGEVKQVEWAFNFVKLPKQAAELAAYRLVDSRELQPIVVHCGPRLRAYRPGDCLRLTLPGLALDTLAIIVNRKFDPATMTTTLTFIGETAGKHAFALGQVAAAPATPAIGQTAQARDELATVTKSTAQVGVELASDKTVAAASTGAVTAGNLAALIWSPRVSSDGTSIKLEDGTSYALSGTAGGTFAVANTNGAANKGDISISAITALTATGALTVTVGGIDQPAIAFRVTKIVASAIPAAPAAGKTASWAAGDFVAINAETYTRMVSAIRTVTVAAGETIYGTAPLDYYVSGDTTANRTMTAQWRYSPAGAGTWTAFAAGITGSLAYSAYYAGGEYYDALPGSIAVTQSIGGLAAGSWDIELVGATSTAGRTLTATGTASVEVKI